MSKFKSADSIHIIGTDAGGLNNLPSNLKEILLAAKQIAAPKRLIKSIKSWWKEEAFQIPLPEIIENENLKELIKILKKQNKFTVILASCDPLWFGIGRILLEELPNDRLNFHPSPTSLQLAFAKLKRPWQDTKWVSLHGRNPEPLVDILKTKPKSITILTDPSNGGVKVVKTILESLDLESLYDFFIFEELGSQQERITLIESASSFPKDLKSLNLVVLLKKESNNIIKNDLPLFGINDGAFKHYDDRPGLITKKEIRVQILAELELPEEGVIWDIGAGVGSIGLEALRLRPKLNLLSIDKRSGCKSLIEKNAKILKVNPIEIIEEEALSWLNKYNKDKVIPKPDRVIMGGGGNDRVKLLQEILKKLNKNGIIVIPLATIEGISELKPIFQKNKFNFSISQNQTWHGVNLSGGIRMSPMNPVYILKGRSKSNF